MNLDRYTKVLMTILTVTLVLNGLNRLIKASQAVAVEITATGGKDKNCSTDKKVSTQTLEGVKTWKDYWDTLNLRQMTFN